MARVEWRKPCPDGCTCGKHSPRTYTCKPGCTCARHMERKPCPEGCVCKRHNPRNCKPGCDCGRHRVQATEEQKAATKERARVWNREYMAKRWRENPEQMSGQAKARRRANPRLSRSNYLKSKYGITLEQWEALLAEQSGGCYLCGDVLDLQHVHVDHSHACCSGDRSCGRCIRGLACRWCNQGVGQFRDDPERMRRAAIALEQAEARIMRTIHPGQAINPLAGAS